MSLIIRKRSHRMVLKEDLKILQLKLHLVDIFSTNDIIHDPRRRKNQDPRVQI